jgi:hypothetical protein
MIQYFISRANDHEPGKCQVNAVGTRSDLALFVAGEVAATDVRISACTRKPGISKVFAYRDQLLRVVSRPMTVTGEPGGALIAAAGVLLVVG